MVASSGLLNVYNVFNFTVILLWKNRRGQSHSYWPPGPAPIPLFGNLLQMDVKAPYKLYMKVFMPS
uniref:Uncharacterized protein n=1 Tax=Esox lucius TaxID=8010 RepID=A0AAY5L7W3_ESOLU